MISELNVSWFVQQMLDKFKRQVGFIKSHSSKKNLGHIQREKSESSDSFSSFEYEPHARRQQFSPYRHPIQKSAMPKPKTMQLHTKQEHHLLKNSKMQALQPKFTNQILKNNFMQVRDLKGSQKQRQCQIHQKTRVQQQQEKKKEILRKKWQSQEDQDHEEHDEEEQNSEQETPKLVQQKSPEGVIKNVPLQEELSMSNINQFQRNKNLVQDQIPQIKQKELRTVAQYKQYLEEESSSEEEDEEEENRQTLKSRPLPQHNSKPKKHCEEQLISEWDKQEFKDKSIKQAIINHNNGKIHEKQNGIYQTRGGICFELDKQQFKSNSNYMGTNAAKPRKRKADVNSKEEILRRRMSAKLYDRMARVKIFGYN